MAELKPLSLLGDNSNTLSDAPDPTILESSEPQSVRSSVCVSKSTQLIDGEGFTFAISTKALLCACFANKRPLSMITM